MELGSVPIVVSWERFRFIGVSNTDDVSPFSFSREEEEEEKKEGDSDGGRSHDCVEESEESGIKEEEDSEREKD